MRSKPRSSYFQCVDWLGYKTILFPFFGGGTFNSLTISQFFDIFSYLITYLPGCWTVFCDIEECQWQNWYKLKMCRCLVLVLLDKGKGAGCTRGKDPCKVVNTSCPVQDPLLPNKPGERGGSQQTPLQSCFPALISNALALGNRVCRGTAPPDLLWVQRLSGLLNGLLFRMTLNS